jgi:hypothetical protein
MIGDLTAAGRAAVLLFVAREPVHRLTESLSEQVFDACLADSDPTVGTAEARPPGPVLDSLIRFGASPALRVLSLSVAGPGGINPAYELALAVALAVLPLLLTGLLAARAAGGEYPLRGRRCRAIGREVRHSARRRGGVRRGTLEGGGLTVLHRYAATHCNQWTMR